MLWLSVGGIRPWIAYGPLFVKMRVRLRVSIGVTAKICQGSQREVANAEEEGVKFAWLTTPAEFVPAKWRRGTTCRKSEKMINGYRPTMFRPPRSIRRRAPVPVEGKNPPLESRSGVKSPRL